MGFRDDDDGIEFIRILKKKKGVLDIDAQQLISTIT